MKRICIIGDSHAAALKIGWPAIKADFPDVELTFFAAMSKYMEALSLVGEKLIAPTDVLRKRLKLSSDGRTSIDNTYDAYLICGLGLRAQVAFPIHKLLQAKEQSAELGADYFADIFPAAIAEALVNTLAIRFSGMLRQITNATILLVPQPLLAEDSKATPNFPSDVSENRRALLAAFESACARLAKENKASFLPQPAETFTENMLATKAKYARGPGGSEIEASRSDIAHMNGEFGAIVLREALEMLTNAPVRDAVR